ncbi:hypothetical protein IPH25_01495 [bacterium]|nr:MAG: hypothetical protein IPG37_03625 [bacterium]QQR62101.1 MAG: hypothetical protein IPH25_01495 [bacterium]QQR63342.1 MAG: hypothetical protein IPH67_02625 [bacterium]
MGLSMKTSEFIMTFIEKPRFEGTLNQLLTNINILICFLLNGKKGGCNMFLRQIIVLCLFLSSCDMPAMFSALSKQFKIAFSKKALPVSCPFNTKVTVPSKMHSFHTSNSQKLTTAMQKQRVYKPFSGHVDMQCKKKLLQLNKVPNSFLTT